MPLLRNNTIESIKKKIWYKRLKYLVFIKLKAQNLKVFLIIKNPLKTTTPFIVCSKTYQEEKQAGAVFWYIFKRYSAK